MDQQQAQNINQAGEELTDSARQSFQMLVDRTVALQESNLRLTQDFFQNSIQQLQSQTQGNQQAAQTVQEQSQRQQQALQTLRQESTNAYSEFLDSVLSFYQETLRSATQVAQNNMQAASQATQQGVQAAGQAAQQGVQAASQAASQSGQTATQAGQQGAQSAGRGAQGDEVRATAAARHKSDEMNVDLSEVEGTGRDDEITINDVRRKPREEQS